MRCGVLILFDLFTYFTELVEQGDNVEFPCVLQKLIDSDIQGLPPGGGLAAK